MFRFLFDCTEETFEPAITEEDVDESERLYLNNRTTTLVGIRNLYEAVILPCDEDLYEWLASNAISFFKEVSVIWGIVCIEGIPTCDLGSGFPPGYEYKFSDGEMMKIPIRCSGPTYVDHVLNWVEGKVNNFTPRVPDGEKAALKKIYSRLFRIFAIVYSNHMAAIEDLQAVVHLNTSFQHFMLFCWEFEMLTPSEEEVLRNLIDEIRRLHLSEQ